MNQCNTR